LPIGQQRIKAANVLLVALSLFATTSAFAATKHKTTSSKHSSRSHSSHHVTKTASHSRGQHAIDQERTRAIQTALIREHYLNGEPSGVWDQSSKEAMTRYQAANGWQTKITPDSRALIKLGLGPDHKGLLNPETASIPSPHELGVDNATQPGGATDSE
jgi:hypothetical protein